MHEKIQHLTIIVRIPYTLCNLQSKLKFILHCHFQKLKMEVK
jgi:hypothetical protein